MSRTLSLSLCVASAGLLGWWVGQGTTSIAHAQEPRAETAYLCRTFKVPLENETTLDTSDRTSEVGQWVGEQRAAGWTVGGVDLETGQKSNGFAQGYAQVCLVR